MEMTKERISFTFDPKDMLLSLQMGFSFLRAAVACAILERTSGLEPSSETTAPRYLKLVTVPNFCPFTFIFIYLQQLLYRKMNRFFQTLSIVSHLDSKMSKPNRMSSNKNNDSDMPHQKHCLEISSNKLPRGGSG